MNVSQMLDAISMRPDDARIDFDGDWCEDSKLGNDAPKPRTVGEFRVWLNRWAARTSGFDSRVIITDGSGNNCKKFDFINDADVLKVDLY